ncbi:MAG TPA: hypothetical protein PKD28_04090 [Candidatus Saccharibacteria bacterium]|nr:hypothetical protein [Candidatus Saccharibacteria bacterium]
MTGRPLFNPVTAVELEAYGRHLSHAVLLTGREGIGLDTAADYLADQSGGQTIRILPEANEKVDLEKGRITVDVIRRLYDVVRTKSAVPRCIIISAVDTITVEAQHAFLKLLEEPTENTSFILLCHNPGRLLPTVLSRVQQLQIRRINRHQSEALLDSLGVKDVTTRSQILFIAEGLPGLMTNLAHSPELLEAEAVKLRQARATLQGSSYERLVSIQALKDDRTTAIQVVSYMIALLRRELTGKKTADNETLQLLKRLESVLVRLGANGNVRLVLAAALL